MMTKPDLIKVLIKEYDNLLDLFSRMCTWSNRERICIWYKKHQRC